MLKLNALYFKTKQGELSTLDYEQSHCTCIRNVTLGSPKSCNEAVNALKHQRLKHFITHI